MFDATAKPSNTISSDWQGFCSCPQRWLKLSLTFALFYMLVVAAYWPVLTNNYGYSDDYDGLQGMRRGSYGILYNPSISQAGRPLGCFWYWAAFKSAEGIDDLKRMRLLTLSGIALFGTALTLLHRRAGHSCSVAMGISALVILTPAFAVYASWLTLVCGGFGAFAGLVGGWLVWDAVDGNESLKIRLGVGLAGLGFIISALMTYQPVAPLCIYAFLVLAHGRESSGENALPAFLRAVAVFFLSVALYYILYLHLVRSWTHGESQISRSMLSTDIIAKSRYACRVLWSSVTLWARFESARVQVVTALGVIILGIGFFLDRLWCSRVRMAVILIVSLPLAVLPILSVAQNDLQFRSHVGSQAWIVYVAAWGAILLWKKCCTDQGRTICKAGIGVILVSGVAVFAVLARCHVKQGLVDPNVREVSRLREAVRKIQGSYPAQVVFFSPEPSWMSCRCLSEFGVIASPAWWNTAPLLELLLDEKYGRQHYDHTGVPPPLKVFAAQGLKGTSPVIDGFGALHREEQVLSNDPYWGPIRRLDSGWCVSEWFGAFDGRRFPNIWHVKLGWLYCDPKKGADNFWFRHSTLGWIFTDPDKYPLIYVQKSGRWMRVEQSLQSADSVLSELDKQP